MTLENIIRAIRDWTKANFYDKSAVDSMMAFGTGGGSNPITIDSALDATSENPIQNKAVKAALDLKANSAGLSSVALSGSYNDLTDKPTIPSAITIDSDFSSSSENPIQNKIIKQALDLKANSADLGAAALSNSYNDLDNKPTIVTYEKATASSDGLMSKEDFTKLQNLSSGGGNNGNSNITVDNALSSSSENPVQNKVVKQALDEKANTNDLSAVATSNSYNDLDDKPTIPAAITIDDALSLSSENPVQNKVIKTALDALDSNRNLLNTYKKLLWSGTLKLVNETGELEQSIDNYDYLLCYFAPVSIDYLVEEFHPALVDCEKLRTSLPNDLSYFSYEYYMQGYIRCKFTDKTHFSVVECTPVGGNGSNYITLKYIYGIKLNPIRENGILPRSTTLLWNYIDDNNGQIPYTTYTLTLNDSINNYDQLIVEIVSSRNDLSTVDWDSTNQWFIDIKALKNAYKPYYISFTSYADRSARFHIEDTTFQCLISNKSDTTGIVEIYGIKYNNNGDDGVNLTYNSTLTLLDGE